MSGPDTPDDDGTDTIPGNVYELKSRLTALISDEAKRDLYNSALVPEDMRIRMADLSEKASCNCGINTRGYTIPYLTYSGEPTDFYRIKVLNPENENGAKYKQPRRTANHVYFPPNFLQVLDSWCVGTRQVPGRHPHQRLLVITEGEKKAACAVKNGIPCVALSGVDSWKNRLIELPDGTELEKKPGKKGIEAKIPGGTKTKPDIEVMHLAVGFEDLFNLIGEYQLKVIIIFDSDRGGKLKSEVQRAATYLAYELYYFGIHAHRIKLLTLPQTNHSEESDAKTGLDDCIRSRGYEWVTKKILEVYDNPKGFPRHPDVSQYLNVRLNSAADRRTLSQISHVILCELDARGTRFRERSTSKPYYFDRESNRLMQAEINTRHGEPWHVTAFGTFMYQTFGLTSIDDRILKIFASMFTGEQPITTVTPHRVRALITEHEDPHNPHGIAVQVSNDHYIAVSPDPKLPIDLLENGAKGIMFEQVDKQISYPLDYDLTYKLFHEMNAIGHTLDPWWLEIVSKTNLGRILEPSDLYENGEDKQTNPRQPTEDEAAQMRILFTLMRYINPWLHRFRGLQLPVEIMLGEAGSGKTSLYELGLSIINGDPNLPGAPRDHKDWRATVGSNGGLIVFDNVNFTTQQVKQEISDDICRLITEPDPHIESRKLYTDSTIERTPVDATFAFTSIRQMFRNQDLFQRAIIFELTIGSSLPEGGWAREMLEEYGGREYLFAHHLVFIHRFLRIAATELGWDPKFRTTNRLAHLEQVLKIAAQVLGLDIPIGSTIRKTQLKAATEGDWTLAALRRWVQAVREDPKYSPRHRHRVKDMVAWAEMDDEISRNPIMTNSHKLGKWIAEHQASLKKDVGIAYAGITNNAMTYHVWSQAMMEYDTSDLKKEIDGRPSEKR